MITRIRLEGHGGFKDELEQELDQRLEEIIKATRQNGDKRCGRWQTTDDAVTLARSGSGFVGRKVLKFEILAPDHDWDEGYMQRICRTCGRVEAT